MLQKKLKEVKTVASFELVDYSVHVCSNVTNSTCVCQSKNLFSLGWSQWAPMQALSVVQICDGHYFGISLTWNDPTVNKYGSTS